MQGTITMQPVDLERIEGTLLPLTAGERIDPESYLSVALRTRTAWWSSRKYPRELARILEEARPPDPPADGTLWERLKVRLERFDHRPDRVALAVAGSFDPDLHLHGRPFFVTEGSAERVAAVVEEYCRADDGEAAEALAFEQLVKLSPELGREVRPGPQEDPGSDLGYRGELLAAMKEIHELCRAARAGERWGAAGRPRRPAVEVLARELPWRVVMLASRCTPGWIGRDVDGLATICRAAGIPPPAFLVSARVLFAEPASEFPALAEGLTPELEHARDVGAYVRPGDVGELLTFLGAEGSRIIQAASRHGEGSACATLLRKIRECATYAERHGMGYLEASGVPAIDEPLTVPEADPEPVPA